MSGTCASDEASDNSGTKMRRRVSWRSWIVAVSTSYDNNISSQCIVIVNALRIICER